VERHCACPLPLGTPVSNHGRVREIAGLIAGADRVLDIGCSSGWLGPIVLSKGARKYVGLDRAVGPGSAANERMQFVAGSALSLPFADQTFDAACLFDVIEHLPRGTELRAIKEAWRILRPMGTLYLSTPHASWIHTSLDPAWYLGHRHYRRSTIRCLLSAAGFSVQRVFVAGGVLESLNHLAFLISKHIFHRALPESELVMRRIDRNHGSDRPLGMTVFAVATRNGS
jgi:SAM-dependent methyltransferase